MAMSKNPAVSQKISKDWFRLPERQELFSGLVRTILLRRFQFKFETHTDTDRQTHTNNDIGK